MLPNTEAIGDRKETPSQKGMRRRPMENRFQAVWLLIGAARLGKKPRKENFSMDFLLLLLYGLTKIRIHPFTIIGRNMLALTFFLRPDTTNRCALSATKRSEEGT